MESSPYYAAPGELSSLADFQDFTAWLSLDPRVIFQVTQGLLIHDMWLERYGIRPRASQRRKVCSPSAADILAQAVKLKKGLSLAVPRNPEERVIGCCREFTLLATALFRAKGVPARARCGFALYLAEPGFYEDHWICEYWNGQRWMAIDPQIDPFQQSTIQTYARTTSGIDSNYKDMLLSFDPMEVTVDHFINAGRAWKMYRGGRVEATKFGIGADPKQYGLKTLYGAWFMRGQLLRDFAALNKVEAVPYLVRLGEGLDWKAWRLAAATDEELDKDDWELLDKLADLCARPDDSLMEINKLFGANPELHPLL